MTFIEGDRVWWWHTANHLRRGTVKDAATPPRIGVLADDGRSIIYLHATQLGHMDVGASS